MRPTTPNPGLLDRDPAVPGYGELRLRFQRLLERTVDLGTHTLKWADNYQREESYATIILLFRHVLQHIDAVSVLIGAGCVAACKPNLRSAFEASVSLRFILSRQVKHRARAYQVAHVLRRIALYKQFDPNTLEGKQFRAAWTKDKTMGSIPPPDHDTALPISNLESWLSKPHIAPIVKEWNDLKSKTRKRPEWYSLRGGPKTLEELATLVGDGARYQFLYRDWSGEAHATNAMLSIGATPEGQAAIRQLRDPTEMQHMVTVAVETVMATGRDLLLYSNRAAIPDFTAWYLEHIRDDFQHNAKNKLLTVT